jgi:hypothetical protein
MVGARAAAVLNHLHTDALWRFAQPLLLRAHLAGARVGVDSRTEQQDTSQSSRGIFVAPEFRCNRPPLPGGERLLNICKEVCAPIEEPNGFDGGRHVRVAAAARFPSIAFRQPGAAASR